MCSPTASPWKTGSAPDGSASAYYGACHTRYTRAGIDLAREPSVGLGSVCFPEGIRGACVRVIGVWSGCDDGCGGAA